MATASLRSASASSFRGILLRHSSVGPATAPPHAVPRVSGNVSNDRTPEQDPKGEGHPEDFDPANPGAVDFQVPECVTWRHFSTCKPNPLAKGGNFGPVASLYGQARWASHATAVKETDASGGKISIRPKPKQIKEDDKDDGLVYQGPISSTIKKVKLLSLSTCCLSVSLGPVITFMTSPEMNVILKGGVASTVIFLSATTTAALHWFVSPYIHKLRWRQGSDSFEAEILSWLATPLKRTIKFADIRPPETNRPFVTFRAEGNFYFVDAEHFPNKALLARLTPKHPHESAFKNL